MIFCFHVAIAEFGFQSGGHAEREVGDGIENYVRDKANRANSDFSRAAFQSGSLRIHFFVSDDDRIRDLLHFRASDALPEAIRSFEVGADIGGFELIDNLVRVRRVFLGNRKDAHLHWRDGRR